MLYGLMGALINTKKPVYGVGEYPTYLITGQPDAEILWSTYINGKEQELEMPYGDYVEPDGTSEIRWPDPFYAFQIGTWKREIVLLNPDGTKERASITFTVQQTPVGAPDAPPVTGQTPPTIPTQAVPPPAPRGIPIYTSPATPIIRESVPRQVGPTVPPSDPPGTIYTPPIIPTPPTVPPVYDSGDMLNPAPPRSIYPSGQEPRPPIGDRGGAAPRPIDTGDILNPSPAPAGPSGPTGPMPQTPVYTAPTLPTTQPTTTAPSGSSIPGSINLFGYDVPTIALGLLALFLLKGR